MKRYANQTSDIVQGPLINAETKQRVETHDILDLDGIASPGEMAKNKHVLVNKWMPAVTRGDAMAPGDASNAGQPAKPQQPEYRSVKSCLIMFHVLA
jgi:hypothetical protein